MSRFGKTEANLNKGEGLVFGPIMRFRVGKLDLELAPLAHEDMPLFIANGGMQSHVVTKYLGRRFAPVVEDEYEWFDRTRGDNTSYIWGLYALEDGERKLIGNSGLHVSKDHMLPTAISGSMIFRPEYWQRGIAKHAHRVRTWHAFTQVQPPLVQLRSQVYDGNIGSQKALESVGLVPLFVERNEAFVDGRLISRVSLGAINPLEPFWSTWWHGDIVPEEFLAARQRTLEAMRWAEENVQFG